MLCRTVHLSLASGPGCPFTRVSASLAHILVAPSAYILSAKDGKIRQHSRSEIPYIKPEYPSGILESPRVSQGPTHPNLLRTIAIVASRRLLRVATSTSLRLLCRSTSIMPPKQATLGYVKSSQTTLKWVAENNYDKDIQIRNKC